MVLLFEGSPVLSLKDYLEEARFILQRRGSWLSLLFRQSILG